MPGGPAAASTAPYGSALTAYHEIPFVALWSTCTSLFNSTTYSKVLPCIFAINELGRIREAFVLVHWHVFLPLLLKLDASMDPYDSQLAQIWVWAPKDAESRDCCNILVKYRVSPLRPPASPHIHNITAPKMSIDG
ncbi:hypothetical protein NMY22_g20115 [Coprinellus aureogranulatus]|nr:hypothetical protein NMY22_g20115 [Coprinellus aureogranulatus]